MTRLQPVHPGKVMKQDYMEPFPLCAWAQPQAPHSCIACSFHSIQRTGYRFCKFYAMLLQAVAFELQSQRMPPSSRYGGIAITENASFDAQFDEDLEAADADYGDAGR